jgi:hypothetical protein
MPTGPKGEKRPADAIARAVKVMRIATGEEPEDYGDATPRAKNGHLGKKGGLVGGKARAAILTPKERQEIARKAAKARWANSAERGKKEHQ